MAININEKDVPLSTVRNVMTSMLMDNSGKFPRIIAQDKQVYSDGRDSPNERTLVENFDPNGQLPIINPETGELIRNIAQAEVYAVVFSVYKYMVDKREAKDALALAGADDPEANDDTTT